MKRFYLISFSLLLYFSNNANFYGWSISKELFDYIRSILPKKGTILEFGSGWTTGEFAKYYSVYSIEHDRAWLNKYKSNYIYAPIKNGWYNTKILKKRLPSHYDLILVDGPPARFGRKGFYKNLHLFNTKVPIVIDDIHRKSEYDLMVNIAKKLNKKYFIINDHVKAAGVII